MTAKTPSAQPAPPQSIAPTRSSRLAVEEVDPIYLRRVSVRPTEEQIVSSISDAVAAALADSFRATIENAVRDAVAGGRLRR